ncbi:MAG: hypothetical protein ACLPSF_11110 [Methylocella sp.]
MEKLNFLETSILEKMLSGAGEPFSTLRKQYLVSEVAKREFAGAGFFTHFRVPTDAPRLDNENMHIGDVSADVAGLESGVGFVLFIQEGLIDVLEGYSYDEPWPDHPRITRLYFNGLSSRRE